MTASLNEKMQPARKWVKAIYAFGITDETFSMLATGKKGKIPTAFAFGVALIAYGSWVIFTAIGHIIGANLPLFLQAAMSIALYAMFIGSACPFDERQPQSRHARRFGGSHPLCLILHRALSTGWSILVATLASSILVEIVYARTRQNS